MKQSVYKRSKRTNPEEQKALENVLQVQNQLVENLVAEHNETHWIWKTKIIENKTFENDIFNIEKSKVKTEKEAKQKAMKFLKTFEGNLKPLHSDLEFRYRKVR
jgi:hypothetical protein